jgi:hypothetical protein
MAWVKVGDGKGSLTYCITAVFVNFEGTNFAKNFGTRSPNVYWWVN